MRLQNRFFATLIVATCLIVATTPAFAAETEPGTGTITGQEAGEGFEAANGMGYSGMGALSLPTVTVNNENWLQYNLSNVGFGNFDKSSFNLDSNGMGFNIDAYKTQYGVAQDAMGTAGWGQSHEFTLGANPVQKVNTQDLFASLFGDKTSQYELPSVDVSNEFGETAIQNGKLTQNALVQKYQSGEGYGLMTSVIDGVGDNVQEGLGVDMRSAFSFSDSALLDSKLAYTASAVTGSVDAANKSANGLVSAMLGTYSSKLASTSEANDGAAAGFATNSTFLNMYATAKENNTKFSNYAKASNAAAMLDPNNAATAGIRAEDGTMGQFGSYLRSLLNR